MLVERRSRYDDGGEEDQVACSRYFLIALGSCCLFVVGSVIYCWLEFIGLDFEYKLEDVPDHIQEADDDAAWYEWGWADDDYVYVSRKDNFYLSRYMIIYFDAALAFVIVGVLDCFIEKGILSSVMILGGLSGLASAMLVEHDEWLSEVFNAVSVHLFLVEAAGLFYRHSQRGSRAMPLRYFLLFGDFCWILGSLTDVVLSYYAVWETYELKHAYAGVGAAFAWLVCALVYLVTTIQDELVLRKKLASEAIPAVVDFTKTEDSDTSRSKEAEPSLNDEEDVER